MKHILVTKSLTSTKVACTVFVRGIGHVDGVLIRQHRTGYITLQLPWREFDIVSGTTRRSDSGIAITELVSDKSIRFYAQSAAGDVWATVQDEPQIWKAARKQTAISPEIETVAIAAIA